MRTTTPIVLPGPNDLHIPSEDFSDYCTLLYGKKGIGKTTLTSGYPGYLNCCFEPGRNNITIRKVDFELKSAEQLIKLRQEGADMYNVDPWMKLMEVGRLAIEDPTVKGLAIDTVDLAYSACQESVCSQNGVLTPFAKVDNRPNLWDELRMTFTGFFHYLRSQGVGVLFVSHAKEREQELMEGNAGMAIVGPSCTKACLQIMKQMCDFWMYYGFHEGKRCIILDDPDMTIDVACGVGFRDINGIQLPRIYLPKNPNNPEELYHAIDSKFSPSKAKESTKKKVAKQSVKAVKKAVKKTVKKPVRK
jgi:hypothetical protein